VLETARGGILRAGLAYDRCDVAVVTNIGEGDHLGLAGVSTPEELARVKRIVVDVVPPEGAAVLKADDPLVAAMAGHCRGEVIFFARDGDHPVLAAHRARGGRAVFVRDHALVLADDREEVRILPLEDVPLTLRGRISFQVENALAATAACWALHVSREAIAAGLGRSPPTCNTSRAGSTVLEAGGAAVIVDYAHNASALAALVEALDQFPHPRRTIAFSGTGDRRDADLIRQGQLIGDGFDRVILFEDRNAAAGPRAR
jgi:cyanophycin synthetase